MGQVRDRGEKGKRKMTHVKAQMPNQAQMSNSKKFKHLDFGIHLKFGFWTLQINGR